VVALLQAALSPAVQALLALIPHDSLQLCLHGRGAGGPATAGPLPVAPTSPRLQHPLPAVIDVGSGYTDAVCELLAGAGAILLCGPLGVVETADGAAATGEVLRTALQTYRTAPPQARMSVVVAGGATCAFAARVLGRELPPQFGAAAEATAASTPAREPAGGSFVLAGGGSALLSAADGCAGVLRALDERPQ
jgi:hypothetical protein